MRIGILGGGVAGLTLAATLARASCEVVLYEQAAHFEDIGAGVQLSPNATSVLRELGFDLHRLEAERPTAIDVHSFKGPRLMSLPIAQSDQAPYLHIHRADLIALLSAAAERAGVTFKMKSQAKIGCDQAGFFMAVGAKNNRFDLCVAADGVHSAEAGALRGPAIPKGTAWRALGASVDLPSWARNAPRVIIGPKRHIVTYPLRGGEVVNIVAVENHIYDQKDGWAHAIDGDVLRAAFADFGADATALLAPITSARRWTLNTHIGAVMTGPTGAPIIGDAALTMLPFMAQGASLAIEDAGRLARDIVDGAAGWAEGSATARAARRLAVQKLASANGRAFHRYPPFLGGVYHGLMAAMGRVVPQTLARRAAWVYDHREI